MNPEIQDVAAFQRRLLLWYDKNHADWPWRQYWREQQNPYHVWLSEIMLQQTVIKAVLPAFERFLKIFPDVFSLAQAQEEEVRLASRGLGYYRRFGNLHRAAQRLAARNPFRWPGSYEEWRELPGIGDYTASAIASITLGQPYAVLDGNVERVLCRLYDIRQPANDPALKKPLKKKVAALLCHKRPGDFNQALMELGQTLCRVSSPACKPCPVQNVCRAHSLSSQSEAPAPKIKPASKEAALRLYVAIQGKKVGIVARPATAKFLKGTWGFYTELGEGKQFKGDGLATSPFTTAGARFIGLVSHNITHHKITAAVYQVNTTSRKLRWLDQKDVEASLVANLDRKALKLIHLHVDANGY